MACKSGPRFNAVISKSVASWKATTRQFRTNLPNVTCPRITHDPVLELSTSYRWQLCSTRRTNAEGWALAAWNEEPFLGCSSVILIDSSIASSVGMIWFQELYLGLTGRGQVPFGTVTGRSVNTSALESCSGQRVAQLSHIGGTNACAIWWQTSRLLARGIALSAVPTEM